MGSFLSYLPQTIYVYKEINYNPFKPWQNKLSNPRGAMALTLPLNIKEQAQISPTLFPFFTSPIYRAAWNEQRRMAYNSDRVELDYTIYKDYRPGASMSWLGGKYINEAQRTPSGPKSLYDYNKVKCECQH